jgi:hypothetical protein
LGVWTIFLEDFEIRDGYGLGVCTVFTCAMELVTFCG